MTHDKRRYGVVLGVAVCFFGAVILLGPEQQAIRGGAGDSDPLAAAKIREEVAKADKEYGATLVQGSNQFAMELYGHYATKRLKESENFVLSPYSITEALGMAYVGARGKTAAEIAKTLHFQMKPGEVGPALASLGIGASGYLIEEQAPTAYRFGARVVDAKEGGVEISEVKANSPAQKAGLRPHDRITRLGDWPVRNTADFANALDTFAEVMDVEVRDAKGTRQLTAQLNPPDAGAKRMRPLVANALWGHKGLEFLPAFKERAALYFNAAVEPMDFQSDQARARINRWVSENTDDNIRNLLPKDAITPETALVLTSAIYFEADWGVPFDARGTKKQSFSAPGRKQTVAMMRRTGTYRYARGDGFQILELPYTGAFAMDLFLPAEADGLGEFEKKDFTADHVARWLDALKERRVKVSIPRFKVAAETDLAKGLSELGMPTAFGKQADFGGMTAEAELALSKLIHKAEVEVNEKGTKASAGTGIVAVARDNPTIEFNADHPFVFIIRDTRKGVILFIGRVLAPGEDEAQKASEP